jgi:hypothetical protein
VSWSFAGPEETTIGSLRDQTVLVNSKSISLDTRRFLRRRLLAVGALVAGALLGSMGNALAQTIEARQWQGVSALTRQPEHIVASTAAEWRSLWGRVGLPPPDMFEPGRMNAVGIFLGRRAGEGYSVNVLSTTRRRDRIVIVFEERMPAELMMAQRASPRTIASGPSVAQGGASFMPPGAAAATSLPPPARPVGQPTSPWAIVLVNRADLPISVEQRLFR